MILLTAEDTRLLQYAWEEWEDLERLTSFSDIKSRLALDAPEVVRAWKDYKYSKQVLTALIKQLGDLK